MEESLAAIRNCRWNLQAGRPGVSTLLSVIGEDAAKAFDTFTWNEEEKEDNIKDVLAKFDEYCEPRTQVIYERYRFNNRKQEAGESVAAYITELRAWLRRTVPTTGSRQTRFYVIGLGLRDDKVQERLLRINDLSLQKTIDICKAAEQTSQHAS